MADVWRMIGQRLALGFLTLFLISLIIFGASELLPGDFAEAVLGQSATPETVAAIRAEYGLDRPFYIRYADWLAGALQGDFGNSLASRKPVADMIGRAAGKYPVPCALCRRHRGAAVPDAGDSRRSLP